MANKPTEYSLQFLANVTADTGVDPPMWMMGQAVYDSDAGTWVKMKGNADGELVINVEDSNLTAKYKITDVDDGNADYDYYSFTDKDGNYYIMRDDIVNKAYRYTAGTSAYTTAWTNRATESYDYFYNTF